MRTARTAAATLALALTTPAMAQEQPPAREESVFDGDFLTVAIGAVYGPSYAGSDDYVVYPGGLFQASLGGIDFASRGAGVSVDFIRDPDEGIGFNLGVATRLRANRAVQVKDPVVESLGKLDMAIEVGPMVGITVPHLLNPYDSLSVNIDAAWDIAGAHGGMVIEPALTYFTPVSRGIAVSLLLNAEHGDSDFMDYYHKVTPAQSAVSGLPVFDPDGGGWTKAGGNLLIGIDLDGNIANGGFALALIGGYTRMLGDAKRSPFTSVRGDADQWLAAIGVGYTF